MRVTIVSEYCRPWPGGISEHVYHEAEGLRARGHAVSVISGPGCERAFSPDVRVVAFKHALRFDSNGAASRLSLDLRLPRMHSLLRSLTPDVVHVHAPLDPLVPLAAVLASPAPVVGTFHASFKPAPAWRCLYDARLPWVRRAAHRIRRGIAVSNEAARSINHYWKRPLMIIPNGVDVERFGTRRSDDGARLLFVGRPDPRKGLPLALAAFAAARARHPRLSMDIVGPIAPAMVDLPAQHVPFVRVHGYVRPEAMAELFAEATLLIAPSLGGESQGIVLLEAMAAGVPVLASAIPGYEWIAHARDGYLAPARADAMAQALARLLDDAALRERLAVGGRATAARHAWPAILERIEVELRAAAATSDRPSAGA